LGVEDVVFWICDCLVEGCCVCELVVCFCGSCDGVCDYWSGCVDDWNWLLCYLVDVIVYGVVE